MTNPTPTGPDLPEFIGKLGIRDTADAAAVIIQRTYRDGLADQYKRELIQNAIEAGAQSIYISAVRMPELGPISGVKAAYVDDGEGMTADKLLDYFGELFNGRSILGADANFQMGARVSTLPWNPYGMLIASWTAGDEEGAYLWIAYDPESKTYRFRSHADEDDVPSEIGIPPDYLRHPAIKRAGHGTVIVLLGSDPRDHTVGEIAKGADGRFVYPAERDQNDDLFYANSKWFKLPPGVRLFTMWGPQDLNSWKEWVQPGEFWETAEKRRGSGELGATVGRHRGYLGPEDRIRTQAEHAGTVRVVSSKGYSATVHWALLPEQRYGGKWGDAASTRDYYVPLGLFGELHHDEIYNVQVRGRATQKLERYGLTHTKLRERMIILVQPDPASARFIGATPTSARKQLVIANEDLPHDEWGEEFALQLPKPVRERLNALNGVADKDTVERQKKLIERLRDVFGRPNKRDRKGDPSTLRDVPEGRPRPDHTPRPPNPDPQPRPRPDQPDPGKQGGPDLVPRVGGPLRGRPRKITPPQPITVTWEWEDEHGPGPVHFVGDLLRINRNHSLIEHYIDAEKLIRPSKVDEVEELARGSISAYLVDMIIGARIYSASRMMAGDPVGGRKFVETAITDVTLTAALLNVSAVESLVRVKFQGRAGFKAKTAA